MERLIPINIVGAKVTAMGFVFDQDIKLPEFSATVALIDGKGTTITSINIDSRKYHSNLGECEKSAYLMELAAKTRNELDVLITRHMNKNQKVLEAQSCSL